MICSTCIDDIDLGYDASRQWLDTSYTYIYWLITHSTSSFNQTYRDNIIGAFGALYQSLQYVIYGNIVINTPYRVPWFLRNCATAPPIDMNAILKAMLGATYEQVKYFVGYEEAYKVALWNEWYNYEFYASLARGFQQKAP